MIIDFHAHFFPDKIAERTLELLSQKGGIKPFANGTAQGLIDAMERAGVDAAVNLPVLTNPRQFDAIRRAYDAMLRALQGLKLGLTPDAVLTDVEAAMEAMGEVTGAVVREDITARIFERFCVGK